MLVKEEFGETFDGRDWTGIVRIPHKVRDEEKLIDLIFSLLNEVPATGLQHVALFWGFYNEILISVCFCVIIVQLFRYAKKT